MANIYRLLPHLRKWEGGYVCDPDDTGGATNMGVTLKTYQSYCMQTGEPRPTVAKLKRLTDETWRDIVKVMFWDRFLADKIESQSVANMCVDWLWNSGTVAIKRVQELVGVKADGIVGVVTLNAINSRSALPLFGSIKQERIAYIDEICAKRPRNEKFRRGWMNRINDMIFEG